MALLAVALWLQVFARWLQHFAPRYVRGLEVLSTILFGIALYLGYRAR
jgi:hypothetical protein